ncbi:GLPGLI family protein [Chitinophaga sp. SYP-B3965]|uniref:GLPGLI family protein n=1 Tax=Chitinophaga sp. SYP-B3965 TaxID=2663120 RepID=UPI001299C6BA|nr:GLPGLI family protein [Chitinophaga sp. SYP-B3965]MRG44077.1 GLPGLI family protein [Chitinophaga sp. SYP-B3965]
MLHYIKFTVPVSLLFLFCSFSNNAGVSGVAYYHFSHTRDTTNARRIWEEDFQMAFNDQRSVYRSYTKQLQDSIHTAQMEAAAKAGSDAINMGLLVPSTTEKIYTSENEKAIYISKLFSENDYLIAEALEKINWQIEKDTRTLLGYTCQKATGICKGRKYTAWFTTDIPVNFGPWKLQGLPGLILEAYDASQRIRFTCTKIVSDGSLPNNISLEPPLDAIVTTTKEYNRMEKAWRENLNIDGNSGTDITIDKVTVQGDTQGTPRKKLTINYPLELTN